MEACRSLGDARGLGRSDVGKPRLPLHRGSPIEPPGRHSVPNLASWLYSVDGASCIPASGYQTTRAQVLDAPRPPALPLPPTGSNMSERRVGGYQT